MATRPGSPYPQFTDNSGAIVAGGSLTFSDTGTSTARPVYGERALTTNLGNVITLNSAGRWPSDVWLSGNYRVILKDSTGAQIWAKDDVRDLETATSYALPNPASGTAGQVLTTTGAAYALATVLALPDPTGSANKMVVADSLGLAYTLVNQPTATVYSATSLPGGIVQGATSFQIGKMLIQTGSSSAPAVSGLQTSAAITFPVAYATLLHVDATPSAAGIVDGGGESGVTASTVSRSASGFTASFYLGLDHATDHRIASAVPFSWIAFGLVP